MDRRTFLQSMAVAAVSTARPQSAPPSGLRKAVLISMLPADLPYARRFGMAREAGFDAIEMQTIVRDEEAPNPRGRRPGAGMRIHSVMNADPLALSAVERRSRPSSIAASRGWKPRFAMPPCGAPTPCCSCPAVVDATTIYATHVGRAARDPRSGCRWRSN
jgi:hypothetical protein